MRTGDIWTRIPAATTPPPDTCDNPTTILTHAVDTGGTPVISQNDVGGAGAFAKSYQSFTFVLGAIVTDLHWTGVKSTTPEPSSITAWLIEFWNDNAGAPGTLAQTAVFTPALANETSAGTIGGLPAFTYAVDFLPWFLADAAVPYWVSVQPSMADPPNWYWAAGAGVGTSYTILFGTPVPNAFNLALDITGCVPT